jgi:hypothetical protein
LIVSVAELVVLSFLLQNWLFYRFCSRTGCDRGNVFIEEISLSLKTEHEHSITFNMLQISVILLKYLLYYHSQLNIIHLYDQRKNIFLPNLYKALLCCNNYCFIIFYKALLCCNNYCFIIFYKALLCCNNYCFVVFYKALLCCNNYCFIIFYFIGIFL